MALSLIFDDTSLLLTLAVICLLSLTVYIGKDYQPLIHPLILSRQADVSPIRHKGQSAIYRNANSPSGLELASQPRKKINTVRDVIEHGSGSDDWSASKQRLFYGSRMSNAEIIQQSRSFARGLAVMLGAGNTSELRLGICTDADSAHAFQAIVAGSLQEDQQSRFRPFVIPHTAVSSNHAPTALPHSSKSQKLHAIFTTPSALKDVAELDIVGHETVIVLAGSEEKAASTKDIGKQHKIVTFDEVVSQDKGTVTQASSTARDGGEVHSYYWNDSAGWIEVTDKSLIAAITVHLAFYPADAQPNSNDHIFVSRSDSRDENGEAISRPSTQLLSVSSHPAGLTLPLLALYTGAAFTASDRKGAVASNSTTDAEDPTLLYTSTHDASVLCNALSKVASTSLLARPALHSKLALLRHGTYSREGLFDSLVYRKGRRQLRCEKVRSVLIICDDSGVEQDLLDKLRVHLSCPVRQAYLPSLACQVVGGYIDGWSTHSFDMQAFRVKDSVAIAHLGPPNVSIEMKVVATEAKGDVVRANLNPTGEIFVRGNCMTGAQDSKQWCAVRAIGSFRSNGTLVVNGSRDGPLSARPLSKERPSSGRVAGGASLMTLVLLLASLVGIVQVEAKPSLSASHRQYKRADSVNTTMVETALKSLLSSPRASWEQGTAQSALLEYYSGSWSVFSAVDQRGPPYAAQSSDDTTISQISSQLITMSYYSVQTQDSAGKLCTFVTGNERSGSGSAQDPASCGEGVLLAAYSNGDLQNGSLQSGNSIYATAAEAQLNWLLDDAPRYPNGAISMRSTGLEYWSDAVYMGPPYLALYGLMTGNQSLLQESYDQIGYYIEALRIPSGAAQGLLRHIVNGTTAGVTTGNDMGAWCTGNGWAAAGMVKVIATIAQSQYADAMQDQMNQLITWTADILQRSYQFANPLLRNYINDTDTFYDAAGSAMIAYATYRLASLSPRNHTTYIGAADAIYSEVQDRLTTTGIFDPSVVVVDALTFTSSIEATPESMAFLMLLASAKRDHEAGNVTTTAGPSNSSSDASPASLFLCKSNWIAAFATSMLLTAFIIST